MADGPFAFLSRVIGPQARTQCQQQCARACSVTKVYEEYLRLKTLSKFERDKWLLNLLRHYKDVETKKYRYCSQMVHCYYFLYCLRCAVNVSLPLRHFPMANFINLSTSLHKVIQSTNVSRKRGWITRLRETSHGVFLLTSVRCRNSFLIERIRTAVRKAQRDTFTISMSFDLL